MNIVYILTNLDKTEGKRFYIGAKQDCRIGYVDGIETIFSNKTNTPYLGSSCCPVMNQDLSRGDRFRADILETVYNRDSLYERESLWINAHSAVESEDFYNIGNSLTRVSNQDAVVNLYNESYKDYACRKRLVSRRDATAKDIGYDNFGVMTVDFQQRVAKGEKPSSISEGIGRHRKFVSRYLASATEKSVIEKHVTSDNTWHVRDMFRKGASLPRACEILGIPLESGRIVLGDFSPKGDVASAMNMTMDDAERYVADLVINNDKSFNEVSKITGFSRSTVSRYFVSYVKRRLKGSDL